MIENDKKKISKFLLFYDFYVQINNIVEYFVKKIDKTI
jgi:hypothetical protein